MKISVIAPNLNEAKHLTLFLKSLQHQTHKPHEVIIVDGGSTDQSKHIIAIYAPKLNLKLITDKTRNFGYIRNQGAKHATGQILFHTSSDTYLEPHLLKQISVYYQQHPETISLAGRTYPMGTSVFAHLAYQIFDFLRFTFTVGPMPIRKYRPSGNFTTVRADIFNRVGGYPEVTVNEDGLFGQRLDHYAKNNHRVVAFNLHLYVGHSVKKFEQIGGIRAVLFYFYTLGNLFPLLKPFLKNFELRAGKVFEGKVMLK